MAQKKSKSRFKKNNLKKPNAKWINNAMKSIGEVSLNAFKETSPMDFIALLIHFAFGFFKLFFLNLLLDFF